MFLKINTKCIFDESKVISKSKGNKNKQKKNIQLHHEYQPKQIIIIKNSNISQLIIKAVEIYFASLKKSFKILLYF